MADFRQLGVSRATQAIMHAGPRNSDIVVPNKGAAHLTGAIASCADLLGKSLIVPVAFGACAAGTGHLRSEATAAQGGCPLRAA